MKLHKKTWQTWNEAKCKYTTSKHNGRETIIQHMLLDTLENHAVGMPRTLIYRLRFQKTLYIWSTRMHIPYHPSSTCLHKAYTGVAIAIMGQSSQISNRSKISLYGQQQKHKGPLNHPQRFFKHLKLTRASSWRHCHDERCQIQQRYAPWLNY